jgi:hypothetical protein
MAVRASGGGATSNSRTDRENYRHWARDVIAAVGLREDEDADFTSGGKVRYVTEWRPTTRHASVD